MSDLTIIIPSLSNEKTKPYLELCLESIEKTQARRHRVILALNGENVRLPTDWEKWDRVMELQQGQCNAVNKALELVETKFVMVSNDDMVFGSEWETPLLEAVEAFGCVSPNLVEPQAGARPFQTVDVGKDYHTFSFPRWLTVSAMNKEDEAEHGFNLPFLTKTEIFRTIGGYDESYDPFGSNSDPDVMYKMMIAGVRPHRLRKSLVYHFSLQSSNPSQSEEAKKDWWKNWRYFPQKWGFERDGRENIWYAGGRNGTRIPTEAKPYVDKGAHGAGEHPGKDWLVYTPDWVGRFGEPFYGLGDYYGQ